MREIKFRAWSGDRMVTPYFVFETSKRTGELNSVLYGGQIPKEIMQYTGLKDKSGVEIYEGDILKYNNRLGKVVWHEYQASFDLTLIKCIEGLPFIDMKKGISNNDWRFKTEVIGNIYQNPELI